MIDILTSRRLLTAIITLITSTCHAKIYDLAILGDSISAGYGVKQHESWVNIVDNEMPCQHVLVNLSADGATSYDALETLQYFYKHNHAKYIIIEIGGNDGLRGYSIETFKAKLEDIILLARDHRSSVMLIGIELPQNYGQRYKYKFRKIYEELSKKHKLPYILLDYPNIEELMQSDRIHPSPDGHKEIGAKLLPYISNMICKKKRA